MKTLTLVSLVFGLAWLGPVSFIHAGDATVPAKSQGHPPAAVVTNVTPTIAALPAELPETASVVALEQPVVRLPEGVSLTGWVGELVKLAEAGIEQDVLLSFVDSAGTFNLEANQIIYLHDIGLSSEVITTVIQHDADIASGLRQVTAGAPPTHFAFRTPSAAPVRTEPSPQPVRARPSTEESVPAWPAIDEFAFNGLFDFFEDYAPIDDKPELSPVRRPYAVQLTSPIVVFRAQGRISNVTLLQTLP